MITVFKFLILLDKVDSQQFLKRCKEKTIRGHSKKSSKKLVRSDVKKYIYSIRVLDEWNKLGDETVHVESIQRFGELCDSKDYSRAGAPQG